MFISCQHTQQSQSIMQFINKLPRRTALNNTTQLYITNCIEIKHSTQISTDISLGTFLFQSIMRRHENLLYMQIWQ